MHACSCRLESALNPCPSGLACPQTFAITTNGTLVLRVMEPKRPGNHRVRVNGERHGCV